MGTRLHLAPCEWIQPCESFEQYLTELQSKLWGGPAEIQDLAVHFGVCVEVVAVCDMRGHRTPMGMYGAGVRPDFTMLFEDLGDERRHFDVLLSAQQVRRAQHCLARTSGSCGRPGTSSLPASFAGRAGASPRLQSTITDWFAALPSAVFFSLRTLLTVLRSVCPAPVHLSLITLH